MIRVAQGSPFKRAYKNFVRSHPELKSRIDERLALFINNPYSPELETHKLHGKLAERWAFSINFKYRVLFHFESSDLAFLEDIGTHDDIY